MHKFSHIKQEFNVGDKALYCAKFQTENGPEYQEREVKICDHAQSSYDGKWMYSVSFEDGTLFGIHLCKLKKAA